MRKVKNRRMIDGLEWTGPVIPFPVSHIKGDTYPMTWAADGDIYTSSGDPMWGYKPHGIGLDVEKFIGCPPHYRIEKVNEMYDYTGCGGGGPKPSGMISVDGVLYLAFQNMRGNKPPVYGTGSQHGSDASIVCSRDFGKTWTPDFKDIREPMFPDAAFGGPAFVNFGKDNENARDNYGYAVSGDQWDNGSNLKVGRVPKDKIMLREKWEFVAGVDESGKAAWTKDIKKAGSVLFKDRKISLPDMVYLKGIDRYLLLTWSLFEDFSCERGSSLFIYEAPEPWGPFTLVHYDKSWETPEINSYCPRIPLKWMSEDSLSGWLQFSGSWRPNSIHYRSHVRPFTLRIKND